MESIIKVSKLSQKMGRRILLNEISFEVFPGECFGVFGTRGTGKTSLLHILAGLDRFTSGEVQIMGNNIRKSDKFKRDLGLVTQEKSLFRDLTVNENLDFIAALKQASRADISEMIESYELNEFLSEPITALDTMGVFQRLSLACAMLNRPKILILDEIIKDIDLYSRNLILRELQKYQAEGGTCVCAFSNIDFCKYMSRIGWLEGGEVTLYEAEDARAEWSRQEKLYKEQSGNYHV
ncbi:MAG: ABC transporter ATP-binding protein [Eubacteriales bacterium]